VKAPDNRKRPERKPRQIVQKAARTSGRLQPAGSMPCPAARFDESLVLESAGEIAAVLRKAHRFLQSARQRGEPEGLAAALVGMAYVHFRLGQYQEAAALAREALDLAGDEILPCADAWQVLGNCAAAEGSLEEARACYQRAADLAREFGHPRARAAALHGLAMAIYLARGQFDLALAAEREVQSIAHEQGQPGWLVYPLVGEALVCQVSGRKAEAREALAKLERFASPGSIVQGYRLCIDAALALDEGDLPIAQALYSQARSIAEASGEPWLNIAVRLGMSRLQRLAGNAASAHAWAEDALAFATRVGYHQGQGCARVERARAAWMCGDKAVAEADLRAAIEILEKIGAAFDLVRARFLLTALLYEQGRPEAAVAWLEAAQAILTGGYAFLLDQERQLAYPLLAALLNHPDVALAEISQRLVEHLQRLPPPPLRVITLGRLEVWQGRRQVEERALRFRRAGELLVLLLLTPRHTLSFEQVAEAMWPEKSLDIARTAFHHTTSALRHALEPDLPEKFPSRYLEVEKGRVTLRLPADSWVDLEVFEAHCRRGEWEAALTTCGGDFLPDSLYAGWTLVPRQRLSLLYQQALLAVAEARLAEGRFSEALDLCRRLLALEPWQERAVLVGMRACVALNDLAGARRLYLALEETLRQDLDATPQEELQSFYRSLTPPQS